MVISVVCVGEIGVNIQMNAILLSSSMSPWYTVYCAVQDGSPFENVNEILKL